MLTDEIIEKLRDYLRVRSSAAADEISDLVRACLHDLDIAGAHAEDLEDPLTFQAVKLYCKWHFGYDSDADRFRDAYCSLRDSMALSGDYPAAEDDG